MKENKKTPDPIGLFDAFGVYRGKKLTSKEVNENGLVFNNAGRIEYFYIVINLTLCYFFYELEKYIITKLIPYEIEIFGIPFIITGIILYIAILLFMILFINTIYKIRGKKIWVSWMKVPYKLKRLIDFLCSPVLFIYFSMLIFIARKFYNDFSIRNYYIIIFIIAPVSSILYLLSLPYFCRLLLVKETVSNSTVTGNRQSAIMELEADAAEDNEMEKIDEIEHLIFEGQEYEAISIIKTLSDAGLYSTYGHTILDTAATWNAMQVVKYLIESAGIAVDLSTSWDTTPLMCAALHRNFEIAHYLVLHGANVNAVSQKGITPLLWAVEGGDLDIVKLLIKNGADKDYISEGHTLLKIAQLETWPDIVDYLASLGVKENGGA